MQIEIENARRAATTQPHFLRTASLSDQGRAHSRRQGTERRRAGGKGARRGSVPDGVAVEEKNALNAKRAKERKKSTISSKHLPPLRKRRARRPLGPAAAAPAPRWRGGAACRQRRGAVGARRRGKEGRGEQRKKSKGGGGWLLSVGYTGRNVLASLSSPRRPSARPAHPPVRGPGYPRGGRTFSGRGEEHKEEREERGGGEGRRRLRHLRVVARPPAFASFAHCGAGFARGKAREGPCGGTSGAVQGSV